MVGGRCGASAGKAGTGNACPIRPRRVVSPTLSIHSVGPPAQGRAIVRVEERGRGGGRARVVPCSAWRRTKGWERLVHTTLAAPQQARSPGPRPLSKLQILRSAWSPRKDTRPESPRSEGGGRKGTERRPASIDADGRRPAMGLNRFGWAELELAREMSLALISSPATNNLCTRTNRLACARAPRNPPPHTHTHTRTHPPGALAMMMSASLQ